jgi:hypothetical protein
MSRLKKIEVECYDGWALLKRVPLSDENVAYIKALFLEVLANTKEPWPNDLYLEVHERIEEL